MTENIYTKILNKKPVIIAEAGVNHNGFKSIGRTIDEARAGADCIKQTCVSNKLTTKMLSGRGKVKKGTQHDSYSVLRFWI